MNRILSAKLIGPLLGIAGILLLALSLARPASGQPDQIIVQNADATRTLDVAGDSQLNTLLGQVADRIVFQYANANRLIQIVPALPELVTLLGETADRIVYQYANANRLISISPPSPTLLALLGQTADRIVFQYANANRLISVTPPSPTLLALLGQTLDRIVFQYANAVKENLKSPQIDNLKCPLFSNSICPFASFLNSLTFISQL